MGRNIIIQQENLNDSWTLLMNFIILVKLKAIFNGSKFFSRMIFCEPIYFHLTLSISFWFLSHSLIRSSLFLPLLNRMASHLWFQHFIIMYTKLVQTFCRYFESENTINPLVYRDFIEKKTDSLLFQIFLKAILYKKVRSVRPLFRHIIIVLSTLNLASPCLTFWQ